MPVVGIDLVHTSQPQADAALAALATQSGGAPGAYLATHWARQGELPHVSLSVELADAGGAEVHDVLGSQARDPVRTAWSDATGSAGPPDLVRLAAEARTAHLRRQSGRLVRFPGVERLVGTLPVAQLLEVSAVDRVRVLAAGDAQPDDLVVTRGHVRPSWTDGELVLLVQPAVGGTFVPFESPDPTPCCADHG